MDKSYLERVNVVWFFTLGLTALAAGILVYILLLESALGHFSIHEASPARVFETRATPQVALLNSDYTVQVNRLLSPRDTSRWVETTLRSWRDFLLDPSRNIRHRDLTDADLEQDKLDGIDVLILPSVRALSDREIQVIKGFMERGGSVLATWTPGVYRPDGSWRGWDFIEDVFGVAFAGFVDQGTGNYRVYTDTFPGFTPTGVYYPERVLDGAPPAGSLQERMRRQAALADFAPLRSYRWVDSLGATPPQGDFATARALPLPLRDIDGERRLQDAVIVTYYTWVGGDPGDQMPYPRTNPNWRRFTLRASTPLTASIVSGYRVKVQVYNPGVRMRVAEPRTHAAGFWYDFATEEQSIDEALETTTGIVYGTYGAGRFVYLGFQRDALGPGPPPPGFQPDEDLARLGQFFANVVKYLRREPIIWVHDWPYPYEGGALLAGIGGEQVQHFDGVERLLTEEGVPGTYFVRPEAVTADSALLRRLHRSGDVGVLDDLLYESDGSAAFQTGRLAALRQRLDGLVDAAHSRPVRGYRPTRPGLASRTTMGALRDAGYTYFLPDSVGRRIAPKIMGGPFSALTRIGVTARSDAALQDGLSERAAALWTGRFREDIARVHYEGGLYRLIYSSDVLGRPENLPVLRDVVRTLRDRHFWIASGNEMAHWWRLHQGLNADVEQRGPSRIFVRVSNDNGAVAEEAAVSIALGRPVGAVNIRPELLKLREFASGPDVPTLEADEIRWDETHTILTLSIKHLKPQQYRIFHIDLLRADGTPLLSDD